MDKEGRWRRWRRWSTRVTWIEFRNDYLKWRLYKTKDEMLLPSLFSMSLCIKLMIERNVGVLIDGVIRIHVTLPPCDATRMEWRGTCFAGNIEIVEFLRDKRDSLTDWLTIEIWQWNFPFRNKLLIERKIRRGAQRSSFVLNIQSRRNIAQFWCSFVRIITFSVPLLYVS